MKQRLERAQQQVRQDEHLESLIAHRKETLDALIRFSKRPNEQARAEMVIVNKADVSLLIEFAEKSLEVLKKAREANEQG